MAPLLSFIGLTVQLAWPAIAQAQSVQVAGASYQPAAEAAGVAHVHPTYTPWYDQSTLTGDWGGLRTNLQDTGINFFGNLVGQIGSNVSGGKRRGTDYAQQVLLGATFDLGKLINVPGGTLNFQVEDRVGRNLATDYVGTKLEQLGYYGSGENFHLQELDYEQKWLGGRLDTRVGWYGLGDEFGGTGLLCAFLNNGFCAHPQSLPNGSGWVDGASVTLGGRVKYYIDPSLYAEVGIFEANPNLGENNYGWHLGLNGATGSIVPFEIGKKIKLGPDQLAGTYKIGGYYDSSEVADVEYGGALERRGRYGGYILASQMVYPFSQDGKRGVILFGQMTIGDKRTATMTSYFDAGVVVEGPFAARPNDNIALGWVKANINPRKIDAEYATLAKDNVSDFSLQPAEQDIELAYNIQATPWLLITPDLQYSIDPGAFSYKHYANALIVAGQFIVTF